MTVRFLPFAQAREKSRLLKVYSGLKFARDPRPKYVFQGLRRSDYEFGPSSLGKRKTKAVFLPGSYRPIMGASPATFYIDKTAGLDSNDGLSEANAWQSLSKITSGFFDAGDYIRPKRDEAWNESFSIPSAGLDGVPIVVRPYGSGAKPKVNGQTGAPGRATIYMDGKTDIVINGLDITTPQEPNSVGIFGQNDCPRCEAEYCDIVGYANGLSVGVWFEDAAGTKAQHNDISVVSMGIYFERNGVYTDVWEAYIGHNIVHNMNGQDPQNNDGIVAWRDGDWSGSIIEWNDVSGFLEDGIDFTLSGGIVQFNTSHDNGASNQSGLAPSGLKTIFNDFGTTHVNHNHVYNIIGTAPDADGANGIRIRALDIKCDYNLIHDIDLANNPNQYCYGISAEGDRGEYYNNIISRISGIGGKAWAIYAYMGTAKTIQNNILDGDDEDLVTTGSSLTVTGGYNCLVNKAPAIGGGSTYNGNDLEATDPMFVDQVNNNFQLKPESPLIDAGLDVGLDRDLVGTAVPQGSAPDIGAFEFQEGANTVSVITDLQAVETALRAEATAIAAQADAVAQSILDLQTVDDVLDAAADVIEED